MHVEKLIKLVKEHGSSILSGWFIAKETREPFPPGKVCGDLREFLAWAFWDKLPSELADADRAWVEFSVSKIVKETAVDYSPETGGLLLRNTSDTMVVSPRPHLSCTSWSSSLKCSLRRFCCV